MLSESKKNVTPKQMPHAGIEPATFCLLDRRSASEPMRQRFMAPAVRIFHFYKISALSIRKYSNLELNTFRKRRHD